MSINNNQYLKMIIYDKLIFQMFCLKTNKSEGLNLKAIFNFSYLNTTFIRKQKFSDADLNYGGFSVDNVDHMLEIGEVRCSHRVHTEV